VIAADLANARRTAWLILAAGLVVIIVAGIVSLPERRRFLGRVAIGLALFSAVYFPAFWNKTGGFAQPARAFHSAIAPSQRDALSNLYRVQEEANLRWNIAQVGPLGKGFGHPINYALPIEDISDIDPYIAYVPHNGVFYLFLRIGVVGSIAFWSLLGVAIVAACRLAREPDRELAVVGMLLACALPAFALLGYNDQGFFYYRVAFVMGTLLGLAEAARHLSSRQPAQHRQSLPPDQGSVR
jgi:O-antigen ligase